MAVDSVCGILKEGQDTTCLNPAKRYFQQAVVINRADIATQTITTIPVTPDTCAYNVQFTLKEGKTGYRFKGNESGNSFKGYFDKTRNELFGKPQYIHHVQVLLAGVDEAAKCLLDALDNGSFIVAIQYKDGTLIDKRQ